MISNLMCLNKLKVLSRKQLVKLQQQTLVQSHPFQAGKVRLCIFEDLYQFVMLFLIFTYMYVLTFI